MPDHYTRPLQINAYSGDPRILSVGEMTNYDGLAAGSYLDYLRPHAEHLAATLRPDLRHWRDPRVGWGLVLPDNDAISEKQRAHAEDAPESLRKLLARRANAPVFRYRDELGTMYLCRYLKDGGSHKLNISSSPYGTGDYELPYYLLICASPVNIPWKLQFVLNMGHFVGRLDLDETRLDNYVNALISGWPEAPCHPDQPVVWTVDHGCSDITHLMRTAIAEPILQAFQTDDQIGNKAQGLEECNATGANLANALADNHPSLLITTSHGMTGPPHDEKRMSRQLGFPVDQNLMPLDLDQLLARWNPYGAIWYAHACCSAGADSPSQYARLLASESSLRRTLNSIARIGPCTAPLPKQLLGAPKPLRAFIGHIEPTFNWTLQDPTNQQNLTESLKESLYDGLYQQTPEPVGMAFQRYFLPVGELLASWVQIVEGGELLRSGNIDLACLKQLTALDRQGTVILGDPTAVLTNWGTE